MPTYQYQCDGCDYFFEKSQSIIEAKLKTCPECQSDKLFRLIGGGAGFIFKGSGFYETDYKRSGCPATSSDSAKKEEVAACPKAKSGDCSCSG